jgi:hypothetical protein
MAIFVVKKRELKPNRKLFPDHFPSILDGALQPFFFCKIIFLTQVLKMKIFLLHIHWFLGKKIRQNSRRK